MFMQWTLYSGYLSIADIIFRSQFTLPPITDLSIADAPNNRPYKTFLVRNLYAFYFRQFFTVSHKFSSIFVFYFLASLITFSGSLQLKLAGTSLWLTSFPVAKMSKVEWERDRNMNTIIEISVAHGQSPLIYS